MGTEPLGAPTRNRGFVITEGRVGRYESPAHARRPLDWIGLAADFGLRDLPRSLARDACAGNHLQSMNAIDATQTLWIAGDPDCYFETLPDPAIGRHPPPGLVLAWMSGTSALHFAATDFRSRHASPGVVRFWQGITIGSTAYWISHNYSVGLRVFSHNEHVVGKCADRQ